MSKDSQWPNVAWITLDEEGRVQRATLVGFMDPTELSMLRKQGKGPQLIDFGEQQITLCAPLPEGVRVLE